jgi:signal transduction histidine kinase
VWAWIASHPTVTDVALAVAVLGVAVGSSRTFINLYRLGDPSYDLPSTFEELAGLAVTIGPLAFRRRAPLAALAACTAGFFVGRLLLDSLEQTISVIAVAIAVYSAATHGRPRWRELVCSVCAVAVLARLWHEASSQLPSDVPDRQLLIGITMLTSVALFGAVWALGAAIGSGRRRAAELLDRTVALEHEREENARKAVFEERVRIAQELHDVIAHNVSLIVVQAQALGATHGDERVKGATEGIADLGRRTMAEMHRTLRLLRARDDGPELAPQRGLGDLDELLARSRAAGLPVELAVEGAPRRLAQSVDLSAFRIVQEALTNVVKHAGRARTAVTIAYGPEALELTIVDSGGGARSERPAPGGHGLIGMRERTALFGGTLTAGPRAGDGFEVHALLPYDERIA